MLRLIILSGLLFASQSFAYVVINKKPAKESNYIFHAPAVKNAVTNFKSDAYVLAPATYTPYMPFDTNKSGKTVAAEYRALFADPTIFNFNQDDVGYSFSYINPTIGNLIWLEATVWGLTEKGNEILRKHVSKTANTKFESKVMSFRKPTKVLHSIRLQIETTAPSISWEGLESTVDADEFQIDAFLTEFEAAANGRNPKKDVLNFLRKHFDRVKLDEGIKSFDKYVTGIELSANPIYIVDTYRSINRWYLGYGSTYHCAKAGDCF